MEYFLPITKPMNFMANIDGKFVKLLTDTYIMADWPNILF